MKNSIFLAGATLAAAIAIHSGHAQANAAFGAARKVFVQASDGDNARVDEAVEQFTVLAEAERRNPVYAAYRAAALTLRARATRLPWKKMSYSEEGLAEMDRALSLLKPEHDTQRLSGIPMSMETKMVAANTFVAVPDFMNRGAQGAKLIRAVLEDPQFASAPRGFQISALRAGVKSARQGEAEKRAAWQRQLDALQSATASQVQ